MRPRRMNPTLVILALALMVLPAADAGAATIKLSDYMFSKGVGDSWTYGYTQPTGVVPDFTVAITLVVEGWLAGKFRIGDWRFLDGTTRYQIISYDNVYYYLHYDSKNNQTFDPAARIPIVQELETVIPHPFKPDTDAWYFKKLASFTDPAGTYYYDVLLKIDLDKSLPPNNANNYFGLPSSITYGVTHVTWYAHRVGELQDMDFDAATGAPTVIYALKSTTTKLWGGITGALLLME